MTLSIPRVRHSRTTTTCRVLMIDVIILVMVVVVRSCLRSSSRFLSMIRGGGGFRLAVHSRR